MARNKKTTIVFSILLVSFVFGVVQLFLLRFKTGDVYPKYSSLRSDPLGVKALFDALDDLASVSVRRNYEPLTKLRERPRATLFYFGAREWEMNTVSEDSVESLESFVGRGGRLVISFFPVIGRPWKAHEEEKEGQNSSRKKDQERDSGKSGKEESKEDRDEDSAGWPIRLVSLSDRWGFEIDLDELFTSPVGARASLVGRKDFDLLPQSISWHSALSFDSLDPVWHVIYKRAKRPVIIERAFDQGTIVLATDSYFLSNEAMRRERHPELLAWLVGTNRGVIFEETHHGVRDDPGIMALARKYRLHGLFAWLLVLATLFVWRSSAPFVPPPDANSTGQDGVLILGRESFAGLVNLLRRSISTRNILAVCFDHWKDPHARAGKKSARKLEEVQELVDREQARPSNQRDPVRTYQHVSRALARGGKGQ